MQTKQFHEAVRVFFKNGLQKYGFLLEECEKANLTTNPAVKFLPLSNLNEYLRNQNDTLLEHLDGKMISAIDPFLK